MIDQWNDKRIEKRHDICPTTGVVTQVSHRANVTIYKNGAYVTAQVWVPKTMVEENDFVLARAGLPGGQVSYDTRDRAR